MVNFINTEELTYWSTPEIKNQILALVKDRHVESLKAKVDFYKNELAPYFSELSKRNPFPKISEQLVDCHGSMDTNMVYHTVSGYFTR